MDGSCDSLEDTSIISDIAIDNRFFEGTLFLKDEEKIRTLSPQTVNSYVIQNEADDDSIEFVSVVTSYFKRIGAKRSFLKTTYKGSHFSLYSKFLPDKKSVPFITPVGGGWVAYGVYSYLKDEEVLFIECGGKAYQFTTPTSGELSRDYFKVDKAMFFKVLGERADLTKDYMKANKKKLRRRDDLIDIVKYCNTIELPIE